MEGTHAVPSALVTNTVTATRILLGVLWAGLVAVGGGLLANDLRQTAGEVAMTAALMAAIAAGQFLFSLIVAERVFPNVDKHVAGVAEMTFGGLFLIGLLLTASLVFGPLPAIGLAATIGTAYALLAAVTGPAS